MIDWFIHRVSTAQTMYKDGPSVSYYVVPVLHIGMRNKHRGRPYKLSESAIKAMWDSQNKCCAICRIEFSLDDNHIDHCHKTKQVRGILCRPCNAGLGMFKDNPQFLQNAIIYLTTAMDVRVAAQRESTRFHGKPCKECGETWRYRTSQSCVACRPKKERERRSRIKSAGCVQ